jgi:hypothetical protein
VVEGGSTKAILYENNSVLDGYNATSLNSTTTAYISNTNAILLYDSTDQTKISMLPRPEQLYKVRNANPAII